MAQQSPAAHGETIGQRLKRLRLERGLSQRELSAPGVSYAYISRIEGGTRQPSVKALRRLAGKLGVSASYLETGSELNAAETLELKLADLELAVRLGEATDGEAELEELLACAVEAGDTESALRARVALAVLARERSDFGRMVSVLEEAVESGPFAPAAWGELYAQLGFAYSASGRPEAAVALFERCLNAVRTQGPASLEARYATMLSYALSDKGEIARAEEVVQEALTRSESEEEQDSLSRVRLYWSLARVAHAESKPALALRNARKAIALLETTEDTFDVARAHLLAASIYVTRRDPQAASPHLDRAARLLGPAASLADEVMLRVKRAQMAVLRKDGAAAVELAQEALKRIGSELPQERGTALWALAEGLALQGHHQVADDAFREAVAILEQRRRRREAVLAYRAWARMLRESGHEQRALDVLDRAADLGLGDTPADPDPLR